MTQNFNGEINTLADPKAALFSFTLALLIAYNLLATLRAALASVHGVGKIEASLSDFDLVDEIQATYRGMMIAVPPPAWLCFGDGSTITWWGRRRWAIEGFFKTAKLIFGLASFGQQTLLGVYRWLILSLISFVLTHWVYLSLQRNNSPDWKEVSLLILQQLLPKTAVSLLMLEIESKRELLASQGLTLELISIQS